MPRIRLWLLAGLCSVFAEPIGAAEPAAGLKVPDGFIVTEFAGPDLANDIYCLHISADGRVVVAGRGYVRQLLDTDGDGQADRAVDLVTGLRDGPMGILLEGEDLYLVELNSFSCSGFYQCDPAAVVREIKRLAVEQWQGSSR